MKENYLLEPINKYFEEITFLEGNLLSINSIITFYRLKVDFSKIPNKMLNGLVSTFRDLSQMNSDNNLYFTDYQSRLTESNFLETLQVLESRESLFVYSQIYEVFESFLKAVIVVFIEYNPQYLREIPQLSKILQESNTITSAVAKLQRKEKNNRKLFWLIRQLSPFFKNHESQNIYQIRLNVWFDLFSDVRHSIVHNRQKATSKFISSLKNENKEILFNQHLFLKKLNGTDYIFTDGLKISNIIHFFNQLTYLIFKSLSIDANLDPNYKKLPITSRQPQAGAVG